MSNIRVYSHFCDDIRYEHGNKQSYMGIYNGIMNVPELPFVLPKLCIPIWIVAPHDLKIENVIFRVIKGDQEVVRADLPSDQLPERPPIHPEENDENLEKVFVISSSVAISPFEITEECIVKVRPIINGQEYKGGALKILCASK